MAVQSSVISRSEATKRSFKILLIFILFFSLASPAFAAIAQVAGTKAGTTAGAGFSLPFGSSLTAGDSIIIINTSYSTGAPEIVNIPTYSGTATLGTITLDESYANQFTAGSFFEINIYHAQVTGSGTCTINQSSSGGNEILILDEFSGMEVINPLFGAPVSINGNGGAEGPGAISVPAGGLAIMTSTDNSLSGSGSYTLSNGTSIESFGNSATVTGQAAFNTSSGSQAITATPSGFTYSEWTAVGVAYKQLSTITSSTIGGKSTIDGNSTVN